MAKEFGRIKIHKLTERRLEASLIWPGWECFQGEDESLVLNYFVVWRYIPKLNVQKPDAALWVHIDKNVDEIVHKWLFISNNTFGIPEVQYFTKHLLHYILELIWKSNINLTTLRRFSAVLAKESVLLCRS